MRHHFRAVAVLAVCLCAYGGLLVAFRFLNQPSNTAVLGGLVLIFVLLMLVPLAVRSIWRSL